MPVTHDSPGAPLRLLNQIRPIVPAGTRARGPTTVLRRTPCMLPLYVLHGCRSRRELMAPHPDNESYSRRWSPDPSRRREILFVFVTQGYRQRCDGSGGFFLLPLLLLWRVSPPQTPLHTGRLSTAPRTPFEYPLGLAPKSVLVKPKRHPSCQPAPVQATHARQQQRRLFFPGLLPT